MTFATQSEVTPEIDDDLALVREAKDGELAAFEHLVRKYGNVMLAVADSILGNREEAHSVTLEAFITAHEQLRQFQEGAKFSTWLLRIAVHESLSRLAVQPSAGGRFLDSFPADDSESFPLKIVDWITTPEELYDTIELQEALMKSLRSLPPTSRLVFVLSEIGRLSLGETADVLGLSRTTARERLFQARMRLRERLNRYFERPREDADIGIGPEAFCSNTLLARVMRG